MFALPWSLPVHYGMARYRKTMPWRWNASKQLLLGESCELLGTHWSLTSLRKLTGLPFDGGEKSPASAFCASCWINRPEPLSAFLFPFVSSRTSHIQRKPRQLILGPARTTRAQYSHSFFFSNFGSVEHLAIKYSNADRRTHLQK